MSENTTPFKLGDVVRLNSQSYPKMTVEKIEINIVYVIWFNEQKELQKGNFDFALLSKFES